MTVRYYLAPYGPGYIPARPNARACKVIQYLGGANEGHSTVHAYPVKGWSVAYVDAAASTHAAIQADAEITLIPFWDAGDEYLPLSATVAQVAEPYRTQIATYLENHRIPTGWIAGTMTLGSVIRYIVQILITAQRLDEDYPEFDLETQASAIPAAQRQRILAWMGNNGIETSDIDLNWTVRQVLARIVDQYGWSGIMSLGVSLL